MNLCRVNGRSGGRNHDPPCSTRQLGMPSPANSTKWLVVGAWEPELTRFRELARGSGLLNGSSAFVLEAIGIGLVDAAIGLTRCTERHRPDAVVFIGTCGSFKGHAVGDVLLASSIGLVDHAITIAEAVKLSPLAIELEPAPLDEALALPRVSVANTIGVTVNDDLATRLAKTYDVEHLEAFAVARAAQLAKVPCSIVLGVANAVGKDGSADWKKNYERVSAIVAERLADAFRTSRAVRSPEQS